MILTVTDREGLQVSTALNVVIQAPPTDFDEDGKVEAASADTLPVPDEETNIPPSLDKLPQVELVADGQITIELEPYATDDAPVSQLIWRASVVDTDLLTVAIDSSKTATITALGNTGQAQVILTATDREGLQVSTANIRYYLRYHDRIL